MPDRSAARVIRLTLPPDVDMAPVASIAVRAAARQVALAESEIDRLRAAVVEAFTLRAESTDQEVEITLHPSQGRMTIEVGSEGSSTTVE
jgi:anti-sigma regulatory factor (Ser/Thr protein kinase)